MKCPNCGTQNAEDAEYCIKCQHKLEKVKKSGMKICPKCKRKYTSEAEYCTLCQLKLEYVDNSKKILITVSSIAAAVVIAASIFTGVYIYPRVALSRAIDRGDTVKIVHITKSHRKLILESKYKGRYIDLIENTLDDYIDERATYTDVQSDFADFTTVDGYSHDDKIEILVKDEKKTAEKFYDSREAYKTADSSYKEQDYKTAEENYGVVIEEDKKYFDAAQARLEEIESLKESYLTNSENELKNEHFDECNDILREGITVFGYDDKYVDLYYDKLSDCLIEQSDFLMSKEHYFTYDNELGAFNLINSYLTDDNYKSNDSFDQKLKNKLNDIVAKSEESEINKAASGLGLTALTSELDSCCEKAAKDYFSDRSISDSTDYVSNLLGENSDVQSLVAQIPIDKAVSGALVTDYATTAKDFVSASTENIQKYRSYKWDYMGISRYYDEESMSFTWAVVIIYESE